MSGHGRHGNGNRGETGRNATGRAETGRGETGSIATGRGRKQRFERKGRRAELFAALALMLKGYRIAALRYKTPLGEIDIVARKGDLIAFVEVKARRDLASGVNAVSHTAQRRIAAAGELYIGRQPDSARLSWRHDIVVVSPWAWPRHLEDAF